MKNEKENTTEYHSEHFSFFCFSIEWCISGCYNGENYMNLVNHLKKNDFDVKHSVNKEHIGTLGYIYAENRFRPNG
jgi:hypothetical protein